MGAKEAAAWIVVTVAGGIVYDNVNDSVQKTTGKKINEQYQNAVDRVVKSVRDYFHNYKPDYNAPGPRARARARGR